MLRINEKLDMDNYIRVSDCSELTLIDGTKFRAHDRERNCWEVICMSWRLQSEDWGGRKGPRAEVHDIVKCHRRNDKVGFGLFCQN